MWILRSVYTTDEMTSESVCNIGKSLISHIHFLQDFSFHTSAYSAITKHIRRNVTQSQLINDPWILLTKIDLNMQPDSSICFSCEQVHGIVFTPTLVNKLLNIVVVFVVIEYIIVYGFGWSWNVERFYRTERGDWFNLCRFITIIPPLWLMNCAIWNTNHTLCIVLAYIDIVNLITEMYPTTTLTSGEYYYQWPYIDWRTMFPQIEFWERFPVCP